MTDKPDAPTSSGPVPVPKDQQRICGYCGATFDGWDVVMRHVQVCLFGPQDGPPQLEN